MMKMINKKGASISIYLVVILTLVVVGTIIFYAMISEKNLQANFKSGYVLDEIYDREFLVNFYIQDIMDHSIKGIETERDFIDNFNSNFEKYKIYGGLDIDGESKEKWPFLADENIQIISDIQRQVNEDNIELIIVDGNIAGVRLNLDITLNDYYMEDEEVVFSAIYDYEKVFESFSEKDNI